MNHHWKIPLVNKRQEKNLAPCTKCRKARKRCEGGHPCQRCSNRPSIACVQTSKTGSVPCPHCREKHKKCDCVEHLPEDRPNENGVGVEVQSVISAPQNLKDQKNEMYERNAFMYYLLMGITQLQERGRELLLFLEISYFDFRTIDKQSVLDCKETPQNFFLYALMAINSSIDSYWFDNSYFAQIAEKMFDTVRTINDSRIVDGCILLGLFYYGKDVTKWNKWTFEALKARKESEDCSPPSKKKKTSVEEFDLNVNIPKNSEGEYEEEFPFLEMIFQNKVLPQTPAQIQTYSNEFPIQTQPSSISSNFSLSPQQTTEEDRNSDTLWELLEPSLLEEEWEPSPFGDDFLMESNLC